MRGKWIANKLSDIAETSSGGTPSRNVPKYFCGNIKWFTTSELNDSYLCDSQEHISQDALRKSSAKIIPSNAILMAMYGATIGKLGILLSESTCNQACCAIISNSIETKYLFYFLLNDREKIISLGCGAGQPNISQEIVKNVLINYPQCKSDQEHIADILSTCDEVIEQTEKVIAKYRKVKEGMLQDLFSRGLDANGKLRPKPEDAPELYKDSPLGKIPKEWEVKTIGNMFVFKNGLNKGKEFFGTGVPIVNYMDVYKNNKITPSMLDGRVNLSLQEIQNYVVCSGDVFFTRTSETPDEVGFASVVVGNFQDTVFSGFVLRARPITNDLLDCYKQYCFRINSLRKMIIADCTYTTRALTNGTKLSKYHVAVPQHGEQRLIAERLEQIDSQISAEERTLAKYRSIKLGLMKRLLTPPEGALEA